MAQPVYEPPPNGWRTFLIIWGTQSASVFGSAMTLFAMNIWLTQTLYPRPEQKPQLAAALAAINLAFAIPVVFGAPIAGAWVDRHDRKRTMIVADFCNGALSLVLAALVLSGGLQLWALLIIVALMAFLSAFHGAAFDTSYAMLVSEERLPRANGMMQTMWALAGILAPAIAAMLIALPTLARNGTLGGLLSSTLGNLSNGVALPILIDAVTFFLAAVTLIFLFVPSPTRTDLVGADGQTKKSMWSDIKLGGLYIWHRRPLLWLLGTFTVANLVSGPLGVFQPLLVKFNLAANWTALGFQYETALALLGTVTAIGGVVGGIFITVWGGLKTRRVYGVVVPLIISGLAQIGFGLSSWLYLSALMVFVIDFMMPILNAHSQTIWQTQTPRELQGRVFAVRRLIAQFTWPISAALAGWAGGRFDPGVVVAVLGAILVIFCTAQLFNPYLLNVENKDMLDAMAARATGEA
jgi:MFS transporter, DHA3 family, macrolide efflux protein